MKKRFAVDIESMIKVFLLSLLMGFFLSLFQSLRIQPLEWFISDTTQLSSKKPVDIFESEIKKKLHEVKNTFSLKTNNNPLIPKAHADASVASPSYVVIDYTTGETILDHNSSETRKVASLTKIMSAVVALDLANPSESFVVSEKAAHKIPTKIGVVPGQTMTLSELLEATLLTSANDAAEVIKEGIDTKYGEAVFIKAMNEKARFLGLSHTSFDNAQGFDGKNNYSTASDFAILSHYTMTHYPLFAEIVKKEYVYLPKNTYHKAFDLVNWNGLIGVYPNIYGVKIGNTDEAGRTMVAISEREGHRVMAVVFGAESVLDRDMITAKLLDEGFEQKFGLPPINITEKQLLAKYVTWNTYL